VTVFLGDEETFRPLDDKGEMSNNDLGDIIILGTSAAVRGGHHTSSTRGVHFFVIWTTRNVFLIC
jgi:hypothetical protein